MSQRRSSPKRFRASPASRRRRPRFEVLESRQLLSQIQWATASGSAWDVGSNWKGGNVPGPADDAVISIAISSPVVISTGTQTVHSVTSTDPISITGGSLAVTANSSLSGGLAMTGGSLTASGSQVAFTVTGTTTVTGASLYARSGATLSLPGLASYAGGLGYTDALQATGTGSVLSLPKLASITGETTNYYSFTQVQALAGGNVQLPALTGVSGGPVWLEGDGTSSKLDVSALASFQGMSGRGNSSRLQASNGGTVLDASLTSLSQVNLPFDSTATLATAQIASFTGGTLSLSGGMLSLRPALPRLTVPTSWSAAGRR